MATLVAMNPAILAFDCSTETMSIVLSSARGSTCWQGDGGALASATLLPRIQALLAEHGITLAGLDAIAFGRGPGAFTGLRMACSVAQGLAFGAAKPVLPVDSLMIVAEAARGSSAKAARAPSSESARGPSSEAAQTPRADAASCDDIGIVVDARMGEIYAARYRWAAAGWQTASPPALCDAAALPDLWGGWPAVLAGNGVSMLPAAGVPVMAVEGERAAALLRLALRMHGCGLAVDAALALPLYLRDKVAQTTSERAAKRLESEAGTR